MNNTFKRLEIYATPSQIKALPLIEKLHILASSKNINFINWDENGTKIVISTPDLRVYLLSNQSLFKAKNVLQFIEQLNECGFQRIFVGDEVHEPYTNIVFEHAAFLRDRKDLIPIVGPNSKLIPKKKIEANKSKITKVVHPFKVADVMKERVRFQAIIKTAAGRRDSAMPTQDLPQVTAKGVRVFPNRMKSSHNGLPGYYGFISYDELHGGLNNLLEEYEKIDTNAEHAEVETVFQGKTIVQPMTMPKLVPIQPLRTKTATITQPVCSWDTFKQVPKTSADEMPLTFNTSYKHFLKRTPTPPKKNIAKKSKIDVGLSPGKIISLDNAKIFTIVGAEGIQKCKFKKVKEAKKVVVEKENVKPVDAVKPDPSNNFEDFLKEVNDAWELDL